MAKSLSELAVRTELPSNRGGNAGRRRTLHHHRVYRSCRHVGILMVCCVAAACTTTVRLDNDFPSPAVDALPLSIAVFYDEEFKDYTYSAPRGADPVLVKLGPAQVRLLNRMLDGLFREISQIRTRPTGERAAQADVVIVPTVERFTLNSPAYHGSDYYEVRVAYRLDIYSPSGRLVGGLPLEGYARAPARWSSISTSVHQVTVRALRDAAARLIVELPEQPAIQQLLESATESDHGRNETI